ncbi:uncharacterized protein DS421_16g531600 [Arachis hypogaea]|nr:uncharacterized protein DS421_16g531600 [Arachis hypogaea]
MEVTLDFHLTHHQVLLNGEGFSSRIVRFVAFLNFSKFPLSSAFTHQAPDSPPSHPSKQPRSHPHPSTAAPTLRAATTTAFCFSPSPPPHCRRRTSPSSPSPPPHLPLLNVAELANSLGRRRHRVLTRRRYSVLDLFAAFWFFLLLRFYA